MYVYVCSIHGRFGRLQKPQEEKIEMKLCISMVMYLLQCIISQNVCGITDTVVGLTNHTVTFRHKTYQTVVRMGPTKEVGLELPK